MFSNISSLNPSHNQLLPQLPTSNPIPSEERVLRSGCYLMNYTPHSVSTLTYDGTLRVDGSENGCTVSGDLYQRPIIVLPSSINSETKGLKCIGPPPTPSSIIPSFSIDCYECYIRGLNIIKPSKTSGNYLEILFEVYTYVRKNKTWDNAGVFTAKMTWVAAPRGYQSTSDYLVGDITNNNGLLVGRLSLGWISTYFRRATIEIDRMTSWKRKTAQSQKSDPILGVTDTSINKNITWQSIFAEFGWELNIELCDFPDKNNKNEIDIENHKNSKLFTDDELINLMRQIFVVQKDTFEWSDEMLHKALIVFRNNEANLDKEWRYHLLVVQQIKNTSRGVMYDAGATDSNNMPREGAAIAAKWRFPHNKKLWGTCAGELFEDTALPFFRTAVHEIGHAMGLEHSIIDNSLMTTTDILARNGTLSRPFPQNIHWSFSLDDQQRLRHLPDIVVRPGSITSQLRSSFLTFTNLPISQEISLNIGNNSTTSSNLNSEEILDEYGSLKLIVFPLDEVVPLGAPVRINLMLCSNSDYPIKVPGKLSLNSGFLKGEVIDQSNNSRIFYPLTLCNDEEELINLGGQINETNEERGEQRSIKGSITLLRGPEGALFPIPGSYTISISLEWSTDLDYKHRITGETTIRIFDNHSPRDENSKSAHSILSDSDSLLALVCSCNFSDNIQKITDSNNEDPLREHFSWIEAKRIALDATSDQSEQIINDISSLLDENTVMSFSECERAQLIIKNLKEDIYVSSSTSNNTLDKIEKIIEDKKEINEQEFLKKEQEFYDSK